MTPSQIQQAHNLAVQHHRAGRLPDAERQYHLVLATQPNRHDVLGALAQIAFMTGRPGDSADLLRRAIAAKPDAVEYYSNLGMVLAAQRRFDEAIDVFRGALGLRPDQPEVLNNLGGALKELDRPAEAEAHFRRAVAFRPNFAEALSNLGIALQQQDKFAEAIDAFRRSLSLRPDNARTWANLGNVLLKQEKFPDAADAYRRALAIEPANADAHFSLGCALHRQKLPREAAAAYRAAIAARPDFADAYYNLGRAVHDQGAAEEAQALYRRATELRPGYLEAANNLGIVLQELGRWDESAAVLRDALRAHPESAHTHNSLGNALVALGRMDQGIDAYRRAVSLQPDFPEATWNLGIALLTTGQLRDAWPAYEARRVVQTVSHVPPFPQPQWTGEPLDGRTILLHAEQGFGDTLQFVRYAPMVRRQSGGRVILLCPRSLHRLIRGHLDIEHLVGGGDPVPTFDVQCPLPSLPGIFETSLETIPNTVPYLFPNPGDVKAWHDRLAREPGRLKVGLSWSGNPEHANDRNRSLPLAALAPLAFSPDVTFVSLQKGAGAAQAAAPPPGMRLLDWTSEINDFADTAALVANLDLVISVDTAVVHLCGATGRPVWVLLPTPADWRWMIHRADSPWYPTARLFRQPNRGDWPTCLERLRREFETFVTESK